MTGRSVLVILGVFVFVIAIALFMYLGREAGDQNVSRGSGLGLDFTARIVSNTSDPASPILVKLVCTNTRNVGSITVSPFPEWGFNPTFLLRAPDGEIFLSHNYRYGPPPEQSTVLVPGQNVSKTYDLHSPLPHCGWMSRDQRHSGPDVFSHPGAYELTVIFYPFYHQRMTNATNATATALNTTLVFEMPSSSAAAYLGSADLSFLSKDLGSIIFHAGTGPFSQLDSLAESYDILILDNVPPEWIGNNSKAIKEAVLSQGLGLVMFGGPNSLAGNGTHSSWCEGQLADLLPVNCAGLHREIPRGYQVSSIGTGPPEGFLANLDISGLDTLRHINPCNPKPGASVWLLLEWEGQKPEFLLIEWGAGEGRIIVCPASLDEILMWKEGRVLVSRIIQAASST